MTRDNLVLWALLALLAALLASIQDDPCNQYTDGTDAFLECETGQPIDLTPIQDEADSPTRKGRD